MIRLSIFEKGFNQSALKGNINIQQLGLYNRKPFPVPVPTLDLKSILIMPPHNLEWGNGGKYAD